MESELTWGDVIIIVKSIVPLSYISSTAVSIGEDRSIYAINQ